MWVLCGICESLSACVCDQVAVYRIVRALEVGEWLGEGIRVGVRNHLYWVAASQTSQQPDTRSASCLYHGSRRIGGGAFLNLSSKRAPLPSSKLGDISHLSMDRGILDNNCAGLPSYESIARINSSPTAPNSNHPPPSIFSSTRLFFIVHPSVKSVFITHTITFF